MMKDIGPLAEILEGVFYLEGGSLFCPGHEEPVADILAPFLDEEVMLMIHHHPPSVFDVEHWGAGSCMWESTGVCPYGHHDEPHKLYAKDLRGVLQRVGNEWFVGAERLDLSPLEGHISRLVITLVEPPESLRASLDDIDPTKADPEELVMRLNELTSLASGLSSILDGFKSDGKDAT